MNVIQSKMIVQAGGRALLELHRELPPGEYEVVLVVGRRSEHAGRHGVDLSIYAPDVLFDDFESAREEL